MENLMAGAASADITPQETHFLFGYPFVERMSTGTHDSLLASALYLTDGRAQAVFISCDVIYVGKASVGRIRQAISERTGIAPSSIMVAATHTHSGPVTVDCVNGSADPVVPPVDKNYLEHMERGAIESACNAFRNAVEARMVFTEADAAGTGTNRHDPAAGESDPRVPVMAAKGLDGSYIGCLLVCSMHPTVLHEDSTLYSGDFPYFVRAALQRDVLGEGCPVVYFTGTAGDQSPRHVTRANTFDEARRIGGIVAASVVSKLSEAAACTGEIKISSSDVLVDLPKRVFPPVEQAERRRDEARALFDRLKETSDDPREIRTAEVDWFGAEELFVLSTLAHSGCLQKAYDDCLPAEIQVIAVGGRQFVAWPGEIFVHYGLELKKRFPNAALITCANGELQGYIATEEAHEKGFYEAGNSFFDHTAGEIMTRATLGLLEKMF